MSKPEKADLRHVPSVDQLLRTDLARELREVVGIRKLTDIARVVTAEIRSALRDQVVRAFRQPALVPLRRRGLRRERGNDTTESGVLRRLRDLGCEGERE